MLNLIKKTHIYSLIRRLKNNIITICVKIIYRNTHIFEIDEKRELYSQSNQDFIVYTHFFKDKKSGIFCDVGGNHPLNINNTRHFEEIGWSGSVFEPLPHMKKLWKDKRKNTKFFPFGASDKEGDITFSIVEDVTGWEDMLSFIKETKNEQHSYNSKDVSIHVKALKDVFAKEDINHIDYMSIDVEGHELKVLQGIDFSAVTIQVLTIENNPTCCRILGDKRIRMHMYNNGYVLWGRIIGLDDIYVRKAFLATLKKEK